MLANTRQYRLCQRVGAHLWLKVVGSDLGRRLQMARLAIEDRFPPAVEEVGHVRILLRLG